MVQPSLFLFVHRACFPTITLFSTHQSYSLIHELLVFFIHKFLLHSSLFVFTECLSSSIHRYISLHSTMSFSTHPYPSASIFIIPSQPSQYFATHQFLCPSALIPVFLHRLLSFSTHSCLFQTHVSRSPLISVILHWFLSFSTDCYPSPLISVLSNQPFEFPQPISLISPFSDLRKKVEHRSSYFNDASVKQLRET